MLPATGEALQLVVLVLHLDQFMLLLEEMEVAAAAAVSVTVRESSSAARKLADFCTGGGGNV